MNKQPALVSVDPGNGGTNGVIANASGYPKFDYFPSVRARSLAVNIEDAGISTLKYETYDWRGERYVIGNDVVHVTSRALERHRGYNRYGNEFHMFLVACSLARLGVPSGEVMLTLFAPPGLYSDAKKAIKKVFEGQTFTIGTNKGKRHQEWYIAGVNVLPEGVGAVGAVAFDSDGKPANTTLLNGRTAFIDIGAYTIDTLTLVDGRLDQERMQRATLENSGIFTFVIEPVLSLVHDQGAAFGLVTQDAIDLLLQNKAPRILRVGGHEVDLTQAIEDRFGLYAEWIANNIIDTELAGLREIERVFLVGGGAQMVEKYLQKMYRGKVVKAGKADPFYGVHPAYWNIVGGLRMTMNHLSRA